MEKIGFLKKDQHEYAVARRVKKDETDGDNGFGWKERRRPAYRWGVAYRVVNSAGEDMIPWSRTKKEALKFAEDNGITVREKTTQVLEEGQAKK